MYQRCAASSSGSAAVAASAWRIAVRASSVASAASAAARRARRARLRSWPRAESTQVAYGSSASATPAASSTMACSAAARAIAGEAFSLRSACPQYRAAASRSTTTAGSPASRYACLLPTITPGPRTPRSRLTSVATFCPAAAGGSSAQSTSTIRSSDTSPGRSTASSLSSVRDLRLPSSPSESSVPSRTTPNVPARRSSTCGETLGPGGISLPTSTSYRWPTAPGKSSCCGFRSCGWLSLVSAAEEGVEVASQGVGVGGGPLVGPVQEPVHLQVGERAGVGECPGKLGYAIGDSAEAADDEALAHVASERAHLKAPRG